MKLNYRFALLLAAFVVISCDDTFVKEISCEKQTPFYYCDNDLSYICERGVLSKFECKSVCDESTGKCVCSESCTNGCDDTGKCKCKDGCVNDCDESTGKCVCSENCTNDCKEDGSCKESKCSLDCVSDCDESTGKCVCPENCTNDCKEDGSCKESKCSLDCVSDCNESTGKCVCPENCTNGCDDTGKCKCNDGCVNDCDESTGKCVCSENCTNDCKEDGSCKESKCSLDCVSDCDESTGKCVCPENCTNGCDESTGKCVCPENCTNGCDDTGKCKCKDGCVNGCDESTGKCVCPSSCQYDCDEFGNCLIDSNKNHMFDHYETAKNQGHPCKKYSDCDSVSGANDGFCDSFIGYQCSTKCTDDSQCVPEETIGGNTFHYVCRGDGRCAPDTFETVWETTKDKESITILLERAEECNFEIDWGDNSDNEKILNCDKNLEHEYENSGKHHVKIKGILKGWYIRASSKDPKTNAEKLIEVVSFGPVGLGGRFDNNQIIYAFSNAVNITITSSVDIPDASQLTSLRAMFEHDGNLNIDLSKWDTSNVTDMAYAFSYTNFKQDISQWDTSKVKIMDKMFYNAKDFDQDISEWDVANLSRFTHIFCNSGLSDDNKNKIKAEWVKKNSKLGNLLDCK